MNSSVVFADINIDLERLFLKESNIKIVNFVFKTKLSLKVWTQPLPHLSGFSSVVVKVNSA
jgi:hypothetical protein